MNPIINHSYRNKNKKIIIYYQTLIDLTPLIELIEEHNKKNASPLLTDITLASIHFGVNATNTPYIHLNNNNPDDPVFISVFSNLKKLKTLDIRVTLLIGGAGGAFYNLFSRFDIYYKLLKEFVDNTGFIDGFNIDIEERVDIDNICMFITRIKRDYPSKEIVFAPLSYSLQTDEPGMGGFSYKVLDKRLGDKISYYNSQCYDTYSVDVLDSIVKNGYNANKIVMGMLSGQDFNSIINQLGIIMKRYPNKFGGVAIWEYVNAPPSPNSPFVWCEVMNKLLYSEKF